MTPTTQVITMLAGMTGLIGLQSFWIGRALNAVVARLDRVEIRLDQVKARLDRVETRIGRLADEVVHEHARRIERLEERLR